MYVKPKNGKQIPIPRQGRMCLPPAGGHVDGSDPYWIKRILADDVEEIGQSKPEPAKTEPKK